MNRTIQLVTEKLTGLLPENQEYYKPEDLRSWGFPNFIVKRIQVELERNLAESMRLPETDWANMQSSEVQQVWKQFIRAIRNEAWLPASYARTVIETAVADVLEMLVEPRKNIPLAIYGAEETLTREELQDRLKNLVVYRHFARLLPRYMEKKELQELSRDRCAEIIKKADEKVTSRYTPLNWAQMLEPLFKLLNEQIDSSLLRLFFEDKKMPRIARKFDFMEKPVNRAVLIETLSSPESLNMEGFEEDQSDLFGASVSETEEESVDSSGEVEQSETIMSQLEGEEEQPEKTDDQPLDKEDQTEAEEDDELVSESDSDFESETEEESDTEEELEEPVLLTNKSRESDEDIEHEEASLNTIFAADEEEDSYGFEEEYEEYDDDDDEEDYEEEDEFDGGLNDVFEDEEDDDDDEEEDEEEWNETFENEKSSEESLKEETADDAEEKHEESEFEIKADEKKETPMWQRFMSSEELEELAEQEEVSNYNEEFEEYEEEPIFDLSMEKQPTEEEIAHLRSALQDQQGYFVERIFGGSERAYDEAVEKIASKKGWRDASRFIEKEVFKRNMIDMYSEEAVDFTDRLHNYFNENAQSE